MTESSSYCFRIRLHLPPTVRLNVDAAEWDLARDTPPAITLKASDAERIRDAAILILRGGPYESAGQAELSGLEWRATLEKAFAEKLVGADFGDRAPRGAFTEAGLQMLQSEAQAPVLNDVHGLMIFECKPPPRFARVGPITPIIGKNAQDLLNSIEAVHAEAPTPDPVRSLAFDLFSASYFQGSSADARFLMLMMAIETLLDLQPRSDKARDHVDSLIELTKKSSLAEPEIDSIVGSLTWLRKESIQSAGRRLATILRERSYGGLPPDRFFTSCYELRSRLAHGSVPRPPREEVDPKAAELERFVGDLLRSW